MPNLIRFSTTIGLWTRDRDPAVSCRHATKFCKANCYNKKLYEIYPAMEPRDKENEKAWPSLTGENLAKKLDKKHKPVKRFRFASRGETFRVLSDVGKIRDILKHSPDVTFWIPTRAWRNTGMRIAIERMIMPLHNARVLASIDPSNSAEEVGDIMARGWSTMYFGDDSKRATTGRLKCGKTWGLDTKCETCENGCFSAKFGEKQVHVHLKQH